MNIEQKLAYIKRALEMGANVQLYFHNMPEKEEAEKAMKELSSMNNVPYQSYGDDGYHWFQSNDSENKLRISAFYEAKEEEVSA